MCLRHSHLQTTFPVSSISSFTLAVFLYWHILTKQKGSVGKSGDQVSLVVIAPSEESIFSVILDFPYDYGSDMS